MAQGFYLPAYLVEPFCLDAYIRGYLFVGRRVGTQNGGSDEALGIPTLSFFFLSGDAAVRASLRALWEGNRGGACGRERTIAGVLSSFDLRAHMKIGC
jgi:hypothetical protein